MEEDRPGEGVKALCGLPGQEGEGDDEQEDHERSLQHSGNMSSKFRSVGEQNRVWSVGNRIVKQDRPSESFLSVPSDPVHLNG